MKVPLKEQILEKARLDIKKWAKTFNQDDTWLIQYLEKLSEKLRDRFDADTMEMVKSIEFKRLSKRR